MSREILIIGLGPGNPDLLTVAARDALASADEVYLRTKQHASVSGLPAGPVYHSFDSIYEETESLELVYDQIAREVVALGKRETGVVYAVPGNPLAGETTVKLIKRMAALENLPVRYLSGLSLVDSACDFLGIDPYAGLQISNASVLAAMCHPSLDPDIPALIMQLGSRYECSLLKQTLMNLYPDEHPVRLIQALGTNQVTVADIRLYELDRIDSVDHLTTLYIPALAERGSLSSYQDVVARLRAPGGCPWDREQTHQTLRTHLLEETYEVLDALDADDMDHLREELGDLLLQVILHAQIAVEDGDFKLVDAVQANINKLVRRHPHVFGNSVADNAEEVLRSWEQIKRQERNDETRSLLQGIARSLPSLSQALEMQRRVARVGFDWPAVEQVVAKVREELDEWLQAESPEARSAELGDLLFSLVNLARWYDIDAESALRQTNQRFASRFAYLERISAQSGKSLEELSSDEMDALWEQAKGIEEET